MAKRLSADQRRDRDYALRMFREFYDALADENALEADEYMMEILGTVNCMFERVNQPNPTED